MGKLLKIPKKAESVTPDELKELTRLGRSVKATEDAAKEAYLQHDEAKTEMAYTVMQLRRKYQLRAGDSIDDKTGQITRS